MRKTLLALSILGAIGFTSANYTIQVPLEQAKGGSLPSGSIIFTNQPTALPEPSDCVNNPSENPVECQNRLTAWEEFAEVKGLTKNWTNLIWSVKGLTEIPSNPFPLKIVQTINLGNNNLINASGLSNVTHIGNLYFQNNQIENVDFFINLTSINGIASLNNNKLTNVDGFINLTSVGNNLYLSDNPLTSIDGLRNIQVGGRIEIDETYSGKKLPADSRFCTLNSRFGFGYAQKSQLCESP